MHGSGQALRLLPIAAVHELKTGFLSFCNKMILVHFIYKIFLSHLCSLNFSALATYFKYTAYGPKGRWKHKLVYWLSFSSNAFAKQHLFRALSRQKKLVGFRAICHRHLALVGIIWNHSAQGYWQLSSIVSHTLNCNRCWILVDKHRCHALPWLLPIYQIYLILAFSL